MLASHILLTIGMKTLHMATGNPQGPDAPPTVLVVEEDDAVRAFVRIALANSFNVIVAASGREALDIYRRLSGRIDLVLMDVNMQGLSGPDTLRRIREINPRAACCFMSGDTSLELRPELLALGAGHVFAKPFSSVRHLTQIISQIIEQSRADDAKASHQKDA